MNRKSAVPAVAQELDEFTRWKKLALPLVLKLADRRPGTYRGSDNRPVIWGCDSTAEDLIKRHGRPGWRRSSRYGEMLLWRHLAGAKDMVCGWKMAYCGPHGSLVWGDCLNVLGV